MVSVVVVASPNVDSAPDSVPRRVFDEVPGIEIEVESLVPLGERAVPYVWAWGSPVTAFERTLRTFPEVTGVEPLERVDGGALYRVEWSVDSPLLLCVHRAGGAVMEAYGSADRWELTLFFEADGDAAAFRRCCREQAVPLEVERVGTVANGLEGDGPPVTDRQREALEAAYVAGYFERPRRATQGEIAAELGISAAATGDRLRRGAANLVEAMLRDG